MVKQKRHIFQIHGYFAVWMLAAGIFLEKFPVCAAQGTVTYGSESYVWYTGEVCPIGVYVRADWPVNSYEVCLEYDETMLEYLDGATQQEGNLLYIRGTGEELSYKTMLHFRPLQAGNTCIKVISAVCTTTADISGNTGDVSGNALVSIEMTLLSEAPITIRQTVSNKLSGLSVNQTNLPGFSPDVYEYRMAVGADVETLALSYMAESEEARVTISDTTLVPGENIITVSVKGTAADESVYTIYVTRPEPEPEISETEPQTTESETEPKVSDTAESKPGIPETEPEIAKQEAVSPVVSRFLQFPFLWTSTVLVAGLAVCYLMYTLKERQRQKLKEVEAGQEDTLQVINLEQTIIDVQHVTMRFKLVQEESSSLKEYLIRTVKGQNHYRYFTALSDVSFEVKQGDVVGIIGTNGSGKSTLLKIISGALYPTEGHVVVDRSKVQMLTLGTGFDMELTAKENVYLNGAIIGYTKEYIDEKYDDIVTFAELEGFMDERMKNFSSGMVSRLGFAIATMRDTPEILILDEVLSVGDIFFKQKSMKRIREMIHGGATVLIVSHSPEVILQNCNWAVWIEKGILRMTGEPEAVCEAYKSMIPQE